MRTTEAHPRAQTRGRAACTDAATPRFEQLACEIAASIEDGVLRPGDRLPSIRDASASRRLSVTTVKHAYGLLESRGWVESRPQSGYFVRSRPPAQRVGAAAMPDVVPQAPQNADVSRLVMATLQAISRRDVAPFGSPFPDPTLFPWRRVHQRMHEVGRRFSVWDPLNDVAPGQPDLLREIARRHQRNGLDVSPDEIIVTAGATEAIDLCLQAVARPGGRIVVESPCYYATLQAIKRLGMQAVELPASAQEGMDLEALSRLLEREQVDACVVMPNFQNPLGFVMSDERKRALVALARRHGVPLIENGVYNELYYDKPPSTLKAFDTDGLVLHCGSFSKSLAAGLRLGWVLPGRYKQAIETLKFLNKVVPPGTGQMAIARFLGQDNWDHHLRGVRRTLQQRRDIMMSMVQRFFPPGTRTTQPMGGYLLWVELPGDIDTLSLYREALALGIAVAPGFIFGGGEAFRRCLRLNYSYDWTPDVEDAFMRLARLVRSFTASPPAAAFIATETEPEPAAMQR